MRVDQFKKMQELDSKITSFILINLVNVITLKLLNKYDDTDIKDIVKNTSSKLLKKEK